MNKFLGTVEAFLIQKWRKNVAVSVFHSSSLFLHKVSFQDLRKKNEFLVFTIIILVMLSSINLLWKRFDTTILCYVETTPNIL